MGLMCCKTLGSTPFASGWPYVINREIFFRLPVDDACENQRQATATIHLLLDFAGTDSTAFSVEKHLVPGREVLRL